MSSDRWVAGDAYETFMGRWSRQVADLFLDWLTPTPRADWLEVGCGTGALSRAVCGRSQPRSLVACDPSPELVAYARRSAAGFPADFVVAAADNLPRRDGGFSFTVSGLVLNFLPDPPQSVHSMKDRLRAAGTLAAYVWDYAEGMEFLRVFWDEAVALDPSAAGLHEARRFPLCQPTALAHLFNEAGLDGVTTTSLLISTVFSDFDDYWLPFLGGTGPAPAYVASLSDDARAELRMRLKGQLAHRPNDPIRLTARAFGVRGSLPS
jgi:SAM-dependent methyltransferase